MSHKASHTAIAKWNTMTTSHACIREENIAPVIGVFFFPCISISIFTFFLLFHMPLEEYSLIHGRVHVHESRADCYLLVLKHFVLYSPHPPPLLLGVLLILVPRPHVNIRKRPLLPDYCAGPGNETMGLTGSGTRLHFYLVKFNVDKVTQYLTSMKEIYSYTESILTGPDMQA